MRAHRALTLLALVIVSACAQHQGLAADGGERVPALCAVGVQAAPEGYLDILQRLGAASEVPFLAIVRDRVDARVPPEATEEAASTLWQWLAVPDFSFYRWVDSRGRFVAACELPVDRVALRHPRVMAWDSLCAEDGRRLSTVLGSLSMEQQALVACGEALEPAAMSEGAREALAELIAGEDRDRQALIRAALTDTHARLRITLAPRATRLVPAMLGQSGCGLSVGLRAASEVPAGPIAPPPDAARVHEALRAYGGYLERHPVPEWTEAPARPPSDPVTVARSPCSLSDVLGRLSAGIGSSVSVPDEWDSAVVVTSCLEWPADALLDALSASGRFACVPDKGGLHLAPAPTDLAPCVAAQFELGDGWRTGLFGLDDVQDPQPRPIADLTSEQRDWIEATVEGVPASAAFHTDVYTSVQCQVLIDLYVWTPLDPVPGIAPTGATDSLLAFTTRQYVLWYWQRLPEAWE